MWELDYKESWGLKNLCFWTVVLEKTLESPLDCKEIQPAHPKGNHSWIFIGRIGADAETPVLWTPDAKSWLIGKAPDAGKDWRWEEKGTTEDDMIGWHSMTWVWVNSRNWWWTGKPGMVQSMGSQRVRHNWATELNWTSIRAGLKLTLFMPCVCFLCPSVVSDSYDPMDCSPPGSSVHGIFQARILEWVAISSSRNVKSLSRVRLFGTPWTVAYQAPLSMGFSRQWYWSGLPFPSPRDLPNPGIEPGSPTL